MPYMRLGEKSHQKSVDERFKKVLNKNDPFDQLILNLITTGALDVAVVDIGLKSKGFSVHHYSRKSLFHHGKHSS
jgi:hypothetical protein